MKHFIKLLPIIFMMTILLPSCDKEPLKDCINDPTCEYFRCKVNGEWWTPDCEEGPLFGCTHTDVQYYYSTTGTVEFSAKSENKNEGMLIIIRDVFKTDTLYKHYLGPNVSTRFRRSNNDINCQIYILIDTDESNFILTKIDDSNFLIEGKFSFYAKNDCNDLIEITEGSFRQKYRF